MEEIKKLINELLDSKLKQNCLNKDKHECVSSISIDITIADAYQSFSSIKIGQIYNS